jgi:hypothetical protein
LEQKTQRRKRREKQRKLSGVSLAAVVFGVILLVGVAGGLFALQLFDTTAETIVEQEIRDFIEELELVDVISYSRLEIDSFRGRIRFHDVAFVSPNPRSRGQVEELVVQMSRQDLIAVVRNPESAALSGIRTTLIRGEFHDTYRGMILSFDEISGGIGGYFPLAEIEFPVNYLFENGEIKIGGLSIQDEETGFGGSIQSVSYTVTGELSLMELEQSPIEVMKQLHSVKMDLKGLRLSLASDAVDQMAELQLLLGLYGQEMELETWNITASGFELHITPQELRIDSLNFSSPMLQLAGHGRIGFDYGLEAEGLEGEIEFLEIHPAIRTAMSPYLLMLMGIALPPEGSFVAQFSYDPATGPQIEIK